YLQHELDAPHRRFIVGTSPTHAEHASLRHTPFTFPARIPHTLVVGMAQCLRRGPVRRCPTLLPSRRALPHPLRRDLLRQGRIRALVLRLRARDRRERR